MKKFTRVEGVVAPLDRANVDTDAIIPKQFLKSVKRSGFGVNLFDSWRYLDNGEPGMDHLKRKINPDFFLNKDKFRNASILLARDNFGCGSSREHAAWALLDFGFRAVIAPSFADIFYNNSLKNGLLPVKLSPNDTDVLFKESLSTENYSLIIDLNHQYVELPSGSRFSFYIDTFRRACLLQGLDEVALTLKHTEEIHAFERRRKDSHPWLF